MSTRPDRAFEELYEKEAHSVFAAVYLLCRDQALAEDATQEAFARALERWERLRTMPWTAGWVTTTAMNVARRALRRRPLPPSAAPHHESIDEYAIGLWDRVRNLPRRQQEALVLHYRLGLPVNEIARAMGCREGTVRTHLARGRERLRTSLEGVTDGT
jgi:RNA polymerase sigma-70 factor (ECF subfamily)